ncbi:MAG: DUF748 domain-containing protein [Porticoccus sp.]|nr:DUF748 domain-containing protein [Porticoccus sp.]
MTRQTGTSTAFYRTLGAFFWKAVKASLITVAVVVVIVVSLLPFVVRWQAVHWLEQQGLDAEIGYINIRPILGSVQINDVRVQASETEQLIIDELQLNIDWMPLLDRRLYIEHVILDGLSIDIVTSESGMRIGGISLPNQEAESDSSSEPQEHATEAVLSRILLEKFELKNVRLCYSRLGKDDVVNLRQCMSFDQLSLIDDLDVRLGEQASVMMPGLQLKGLRWSDQKETAELLSLGLLNISDVGSENMQQWKVATIAVDDVRVLPAKVHDEMTAGDIQLKTLMLSDLIFGEENKIGLAVLSDVEVKLQADENIGFALVPELIRRVDQLLPLSEEQKLADEPENDTTFFLGTLSVTRVSVYDAAEDLRLLSLHDLDLQRLSVRGGDIGLDLLQLSGLTLLPSSSEDTPLSGDLHLGTLSVSGLALGNVNQLDDVSLKSIQIGLSATDDGQLAFAPKLLERFRQTGSQAASEENENIEGSVTALAEELDKQNTGTNTVFSLARLALDDVVVLDVTNNRDLFLMRHVDLMGLKTKGDDLSFDQFQLFDLQLLELEAAHDVEGRHYFSSPKVMLAGVTKEDKQLNIADILVEDPKAYIYRNAKGELQLLSDINSMLGATSQSSEPDLSDSGSPLTFVVGAIKIGPEGQVVVFDESVSPVFRQEYKDLNLIVDHVDSSSPDTKTTLSFDVGIDKFGRLKLVGDLTPFSEKLNTNISGELRDLDLRPLSAYAGQYIGYSLAQGVAEADINFDVHQNDIDAAITTRFRKLEVLPLRGDELPEGSEALGVPLEFALGLLRDKNGMIELKLPVTGDIHSPDFSLRHIIGKVMLKVISETIVNYYLPFGLIVAATMQDTLSNLSFESIGFSPGDIVLDSEAIANLDKLSSMLKSREQLHLSFCAPSTWQDWSAKFAPQVLLSDEKLTDVGVETSSGSLGHSVSPEKEVPEVTKVQIVSLKLLANQRSDAVKEYLVNEGVQSGQIILCEGGFDQTNQMPPQMHIAL